MQERRVEILLVEQDGDLAEMMEGYLCEALPAGVTSVSSAQDALRAELTHHHDLVLANLTLPNGDGLELIRQLRISNKCPIILLADTPMASQMVDAIRLGVKDVFVKPFDFAAVTESASEAIKRRTMQRDRRRRYHRLRKLTGRIIRERRELRERTDLICQDLVHAYRRLAQKVAESSILTHE